VILKKKDKKYSIKEIFYSIQGEGLHTGKPAIFIRFSGCNLWSGLEKDRGNAICKFCDTDFKGVDGDNGGVYKAYELLDKIKGIKAASKCKFIVLTGGEPLLQLDEDLIASFHENNYFLALETNGTLSAIESIDWITVSPKIGSKFIQKSGDELKIVYPQDNLDLSYFENLDFNHFFLQPKEDNTTDDNVKKTLDYCLNNPVWKLSLQIHKVIDIQ